LCAALPQRAANTTYDLPPPPRWTEELRAQNVWEGCHNSLLLGLRDDDVHTFDGNWRLNIRRGRSFTSAHGVELSL
jgi:hypothetical protein